MVTFTARGNAGPLVSGPCDASDAGTSTSSGTARPISIKLPFASLSLGSLPPAARPPVKEQRTGVQFPGEFCFEQTRGCPVITGTGARRKRLAGIKNLDVYALGLYVAEGEARRELRGYSGQRLLDELVNHTGIEKTLRIVITSGLVKRGSFLDALSERLEGPLAAAGARAALAAFQRQFDSAQFRKGLEICFTWTRSGQLVTQVDGARAGALSDAALRRALLQLYLGPDPVSAEAKASIGRGLEAMVAA